MGPACSRFQSSSQFIVRCHHCRSCLYSIRCGLFHTLFCAIKYFFIFTSLWDQNSLLRLLGKNKLALSSACHIILGATFQDEDARLHQPPVPSLTNRCIIPNIVFCVLWVVSGRGHNKTGHWDLSRLYQSYISVISALYRHVVSKLQWSSVPKLRAAAW